MRARGGWRSPAGRAAEEARQGARGVGSGAERHLRTYDTARPCPLGPSVLPVGPGGGYARPRSRRGRSTCRPRYRVAAAMFSTPARRRTLMATLRNVAIA